MDKDLENILKKEKVISAKDAASVLGNRQRVYRLAEKGELVHVYPDGCGHFSLPDTEEGEAQFAIVTKYYSNCIVSGPTGLSLYGLSDEYIREIDVDIPNTTSLSNALLKVHRVHPDKIKGDIYRSFEDRGVSTKIRIYSPERILHDAYKYFKLSDSFYRALKRYRKNYLDKKSPAKQYSEILSFDKKIGTTIVNFLQMEDVDE
jgi:hypothetical protein